MLFRLLARLPLPVIHGLGSLAGYGLTAFPNRLRAAGRENLAHAYPELGRDQRAALLRASLVELGKSALEMAPIWLWPAERMLGKVVDSRGEALISDALSRGRGVILATPHLGAWELAGLWCAARFPMTTLYRPPRLHGLQSWITAARSRSGGRYRPADPSGVRDLYRALRANQVVGLLPDQKPALGSGLWSPFFGRPTYTMTLLCRLARSQGAPVIFTACLRLPRGRGYKIHFQAAPEIGSAGSLAEAVSAMNRHIEDMIRRCPEQYQWAYRRFRGLRGTVAEPSKRPSASAGA